MRQIPDISINQIFEKDIPTLIQLEQAATRNPWTETNLRDALASNSSCRKLVSKRELIGYGVFQVMGDTAEIHNIVIFQSWKNQGLGKKLLFSLISEIRSSRCSRIWLDVRASNEVAIHLYESIGFIKSGQRKNYYKHGEEKENALLMEKMIW